MDVTILERFIQNFIDPYLSSHQSKNVKNTTRKIGTEIIAMALFKQFKLAGHIF